VYHSITDINPKGLVPAIEYKGQALYESLVISEFLEEAYPQHEPHLLPDDPFARAHVRLELDHISKSILPAFFRTIQAQDPQKQKENREELEGELRKLAKKVKGPYFLGEQFSLVDVAIAPWVVRDYIVKENRGYAREAVGEGWPEYAKKLETRESIIRTQSVSYISSQGNR
jgi:glutathione S-transferase